MRPCRRVIAVVLVSAVASTGSGAATAPTPAPDVKTLEDIRIEGEIRLPRVLFITSREAERPLEFLPHYLSGLDEETAEGLIPVVGDIPPFDEASADTMAVDPGEPATQTTTPAPEEIHP